MMDIKRASLDDIPLIVDFGKRLTKLHFELDPAYYTFDEPNFGQEFSDWLRNQISIPSSIIFVAKDGNQVVGFISGFIKYLFPWFHIKKVGHISFMFIDEKYRRIGVGKKLLEEVKKWFKDEGLGYIELYVNESNANGLSFWKSVGFDDFQKFLRMRI